MHILHEDTPKNLLTFFCKWHEIEKRGFAIQVC